MQTLKKLVAGTLAGVMLSSLTGCYTVTVQGANLDKPVSVSHSIGRSATPVSDFHVETVAWYVLGLVPVFTVPGGNVPFMTPANKITEIVARDQLQRGGKGIIDLKVTTQNDIMSWALGTLASILWIGALVQPISVHVDGKVVK